MTDSLLHAGETIDYNGKKVTYAPFKMAIFTGCNQWHRHSERNKMKQAFQNWKPLFRSTTVGRQPAASPTSCCRPVPHLNATILTPTAHYSNRGVIAMHKLVDPLYDSRSDFEIFRDLCRRFGKEKEYSRGMDEMQWVEKLYKDCRRENRGKFEMPEFAEFWQKGYVLFPEGKPWVRHADFREDPELHALGTPSGFIEIYSNKIASFGYDDCKGHPMWFEKAERSHGGKIPTNSRTGCNQFTRTNAYTLNFVNRKNCVKLTACKGVNRFTLTHKMPPNTAFKTEI
ncbi:Trimethylamine-N-oxide reductase precursor [Mannheimia haemolytica]|uniref:Trimethylamine-N-oxide reductase n=1 Tax=Mannheimia haemolytica TaxID=75985 RepID=A0A378MV58_MANHA|nr:Trimethylamine-N-oxide reductase precursor [Mannheimia haemolytica]